MGELDGVLRLRTTPRMVIKEAESAIAMAGRM